MPALLRTDGCGERHLIKEICQRRLATGCHYRRIASEGNDIHLSVRTHRADVDARRRRLVRNRALAAIRVIVLLGNLS
jgi:hypothetical protein